MLERHMVRSGGGPPLGTPRITTESPERTCNYKHTYLLDKSWVISKYRHILMKPISEYWTDRSGKRGRPTKTWIDRIQKLD